MTATRRQLPKAGGSYVRQSDGKLERRARTIPFGDPRHGVEPAKAEPAAAEAAAPKKRSQETK